MVRVPGNAAPAIDNRLPAHAAKLRKSRKAMPRAPTVKMLDDRPHALDRRAGLFDRITNYSHVRGNLSDLAAVRNFFVHGIKLGQKDVGRVNILAVAHERPAHHNRISLKREVIFVEKLAKPVTVGDDFGIDVRSRIIGKIPRKNAVVFFGFGDERIKIEIALVRRHRQSKNF